jgi:hypothetical protein
MWLGRPVVVPNVVVFHDDIGAFVSVFDEFPAMNRSIFFFLINKNDKSFVLFQKIYYYRTIRGGAAIQPLGSAEPNKICEILH